jgi:hypothetical protein
MPHGPAPRAGDRLRDAAPVVGAALVPGGTLTRLARRQNTDPDAFISNRELFGDLADDKRFVAAYRTALTSLHERGARATLESLV